MDPDSGATISGRIDCLVLTATRVTAYDCKVGQPDSTRALQVMLYLHALRQDARLDGRTVEGILVYPETQLSVAAPPPSFAADVAHFARLLAGPTPALKVPGPNCRFCPISRIDCPERLETVGEGVPPPFG